MCDKHLNVGIVVRCVYDYKLPLYKELRHRGRMNLTVFHSNRDLKDHSKVSDDNKIKEFANYVKGYLIRFGKVKFILQPSIIMKIVFGNFDLVVCEYGKSIIFSQLCLVLCKLVKKKFLWWAAGWEAIPFPKIYFAYKAYNKIFWKLADGAIVYHSIGFRKLVDAGMPAGNVYIAQNTRDDRWIAAEWDDVVRQGQVLRTDSGIKEDDKVIMFVGALTKPKRVDVLIRAFGRISACRSDVHLVIVGDGEQRSALERIRREMGIGNVKFAGIVMEKVYHYLSMSDVVVLPGLGGLAINDAMMCRKPVICSSADGSEKDLIEEGVTGYILPEGILDDYSLAAKIEAVIGNGNVSKQMGENAYQRYLKIATFNQMVESFETAIIEIGIGKEPFLVDN